MSFELILPFIEPIRHLIEDEEISEIMVNPYKPPAPQVFFERAGALHATDIEIEDEHLQTAIRMIARTLGQDVNESRPLLDARLPDGSRVAAAIPPASVGGSVVTIRKFPKRHFSAAELVARKMLSQDQLDVLVAAIGRRENILISGGTGSGKTTLLNALCAFIPSTERMVVIEDTSEISIAAPNMVRFEARRALNDTPAITIGELLRATLRHRPDRILLGEVRGSEAFDLLQALNSGHSGTLSTIHSNSARSAGTRLLHCVQQAGQNIPAEAISASIADAIQWLLHIERREGHRYIKEILRVQGFDASTNTYNLEVM
jgi:pilus assembly protein CpaF